MRESTDTGLVWASLGIIYVVWGSTYLAIRVMVETLPPLIASGLRFTLAGVVFALAVWIAGGAERLRARPSQLLGVALVGLLLCLGGNGLVTVAEQDVPSGFAALVIGSVPLWVIVLRTLHGDRVPGATLLGVVIGFAGLTVLLLPGDRPGDAPLGGVLLLVAAAICWASGSFYAPRLPLPRDVFATAAWQMLFGGIGSLAVGLALGEGADVHPSQFSTDSILAFVYLVLIGSLLAYTAYTWLLRNVPISKVATYAYVNPVIAILLGWLILDEEITLTMVVGAAAIVLSVAAVIRRESASPPDSPSRPSRPSPRVRGA
jgi:drug/metabolite transporter (DMT)-like permease